MSEKGDDEAHEPTLPARARGRDVVISIRPQYAAQIFAGTKRVELRRTRPSFARGQRLWLYESGASKALVGWLEVAAVHAGDPGAIWERWHAVSGIDGAGYDAYFAGARCAYAIEIARAERIAPVPLATLRERGRFVAPQSWARMDMATLLGEQPDQSESDDFAAVQHGMEALAHGR